MNLIELYLKVIEVNIDSLRDIEGVDTSSISAMRNAIYEIRKLI